MKQYKTEKQWDDRRGNVHHAGVIDDEDRLIELLGEPTLKLFIEHGHLVEVVEESAPADIPPAEPEQPPEPPAEDDTPVKKGRGK